MSSYGLSSETKKSVKSTVLALRKLLEGEFDPDTGEPIPPGGDVARQISRYGILVNNPESFKRENAPEYLTNEEKNKRERICAAIKRELAIFGKLSDKAALRRGMRAFIRQTSYTWINRLLGLRCMEARGLLKDDRGELDFVVTPSDDYGGLPRRAWRIKGEDPVKWQTAKLYDLQCEAIADACRQLTQEIKVLFDPEHDYGLIWPSAPALNTLLQKIQELDKVATPSPFTSPDFLGWVYQYFQTIEKNLVFEAASKRNKKIEKDDIIAATQIYTEHYMVEHLVQNSLGRLWMEMHPDSKLSAKWAYYVKPPEQNPPVERELKKAIEIKLIDPALGSGHFHLVSFDLLLDMYEEEIENAGKPGWPETPSVEDKKDIPAAILEHNLFGIDIDARSIQLASLVLVMKAREMGYEGPINRLNLVVANSAPFECEAWYQFIQNLEKERKHSVARVLANLGIQLKNLDEFGSLLRIEDEMQKIIQEEKKQWIGQAKAGMEQEYLFPEMTKPKQEKLPFETAITDETFFDRLGSVIHKELDTFYLKSRQDGLAEEAIMAADAERGFDFARLSMQRYDAVYTNPPYMGSKHMGGSLKKFLSEKYPEGKRDLYAAFILRCWELSKENGYVGMVTRKIWMFMTSFTKMREELLKTASISNIADLGSWAFDAENKLHHGVTVVLFTLRRKYPSKSHEICAIRAISPKYPDKKSSYLRSNINNADEILYSNQLSYLDIPNSPIIYWIRPKFAELLSSPDILAKIDQPHDGMTTGDNQRFLRFFWEIWGEEIGSRWRPYAKGGGYQKWCGKENLCCDWDNSGAEIKNHPRSYMRNESYYFQDGLTYSLTAGACLGVRLLSRSAFDPQSPSFFPSLNRFAIMGALNCRLFTYLLRLTSPGLIFNGGYVGRVPLDIPMLSDALERISLYCTDLKRFIVSHDHVERSFHTILSADNIGGEPRGLRDFFEQKNQNRINVSALLSIAEAKVEADVFDNFKLSVDDKNIVTTEIGTPAGWFPLIQGYDEIPSSPVGLPNLPEEVINFIEHRKRIVLSPKEMTDLKKRIKLFCEAGPGSNEENLGQAYSNGGSDDEVVAIGSRIPIPAETFIEELSQKLEINPVSIYWLFTETGKNKGVLCHSELKQFTEDYVSIMILHMLGYQWPKQVEAGESLPEWADDDGIIPLTDGLGEPTLLDRIRNRFGADFGEEKESSIESEFANIVGKPLERWLEEDFFARHVKQFKNRPIAWHIVSDPSVVNHRAGPSGKGKMKGGKKKQKPAFSVMVHYHRFVDGDKGYGKLLLLKNKYLEKLMSQTRSELESLRGKGDDPKIFDRIAELDRKLLELEDFRERLERIQEGKDPESRIFVRWKSAEEQPQGWRPDINDGVKINIAPWERLGMFPVKKIVGEVEIAPK